VFDVPFTFAFLLKIYPSPGKERAGGEIKKPHGDIGQRFKGIPKLKGT
jgi:hypothetical protein